MALLILVSFKEIEVRERLAMELGGTICSKSKSFLRRLYTSDGSCISVFSSYTDSSNTIPYFSSLLRYFSDLFGILKLDFSSKFEAVDVLISSSNIHHRWLGLVVVEMWSEKQKHCMASGAGDNSSPPPSHPRNLPLPYGRRSPVCTTLLGVTIMHCVTRDLESDLLIGAYAPVCMPRTPSFYLVR